MTEKELLDKIDKTCDNIERIWGDSKDGSFGAAFYYEVRPLIKDWEELTGKEWKDREK